MAPDNILPHNRHLMGHSEFLHGSRLICLPLNTLEKLQARRGRDSSTSSLLMWYNTHIFWRTTPNIETSNALVHRFEKIPVLVVTVELIWLLFLNILSFNFLQTPNKSLKFIKFRKSNLHRSVVVQTKHCQFALLFLLDLRCLKCSHYFFGDCLAPTIVHLQNLFLIKHTCCSNVVNSKVGKQTKACDIIIHNSWR